MDGPQMKGLGKMDLFFLSIKRSGQKKNKKKWPISAAAPLILPYMEMVASSELLSRETALIYNRT